MSFNVITQAISREYQIKKSRFIAKIDLVTNIGQASQFLNEQKTTYPDARHHCFAYIIGAPKNPKTSACSDDGEPNSTAGKPILNVLIHGNIGDCMIVVSRYFGGVKLGTGGLVRAYSCAANEVYSAVSTKPYIKTISCRINCNFGQEQFIRHILNRYKATVHNCTYTNELNMNVTIPADAKTTLMEESMKHQFLLSIDTTK